MTVGNSLKKSRDAMKTSYDKKTNNLEFNIGDKVMLWKPYKKSGISRCFQPNWHGPWDIVEYTGSTNCRIKKDNKELNVHFNQLKHCTPRNKSLEYSETPLLTNDTSFNHYLEDFYINLSYSP